MDNITNIKVGGVTYAVGLPHFYVNAKGNLNIETSETNVPAGTKGKINIESKDDIQFKPGDDIIFYSHHRALDKQDEVNVKMTDGDDNPVKLQLTATSLTLQNEFKTNIANRSEIFDINVNTGGENGSNGKGYLKVRARAIDLRCEDHGGIALQPKGRDHNNTGNMNKIKFEHGGGDGLEFGTFNTEKTSIFTDEYRFNRDGIVKMASREKVVSDKYDATDSTTQYKYVKQADDFYDVIADDDEQTTWHDIIKTSNALNQRKNGQKMVETNITSKGNVQIATKNVSVGYTTISSRVSDDIKECIDRLIGSHATEVINAEFVKLMNGETAAYGSDRYLKILPLKQVEGEETIYALFDMHIHNDDDKLVFVAPSSDGVFEEPAAQFIASNGNMLFRYNDVITNLNSVTPTVIPVIECANLNLESDKNISITAENELYLGGTLNFGSSFNFGETDKGIFADIKLTKKGNEKDCGIIRINYTNNGTSSKTVDVITSDNGYNATPTAIPAGMTQEIASVSLYDIAKLVNYMKGNNQGPWATA